MEIIKADKKKRKFFIIGILILGCAVALVLFNIHEHFENLALLAKTSPQKVYQEIILWFNFFWISGCVGLIFFGIYFIRFGRKVLELKQFPWSGTWVLRDTPVLRGEPAVTRGNAALFIGVMMFVAGFLFIYSGFKIWKMLVQAI